MAHSNKSQNTPAPSRGDWFIYSTLSNDQSYTLWEPVNPEHKGGPNVAKRAVFVAGKVNVVDPVHFVTPRGVVTKVSNDDMEFLERDPSFQRHKDAGYITVERQQEAPEKVAKNMTPKDSSAPLTKDDFKTGDTPKPTTNKKD